MNEIERYKEIFKGVCNTGANPDEVDALLNEYDIHDQTYREWLIQINGGPIGADWYDSIQELKNSQVTLKNDWSISGFAIGWDGAGNPIVLQPDQSIATQDHNFGGNHIIANNFKTLLIDATSS
ncbi:hypothetical protein AAEH73_20325 [Shewanella algae]|uniref:hypothetical protein n=1 Tax=Shewanella algae TaxID=38313 RepID=UPI00313E0B08